MEPWREELYHHGIKGQKWGDRNYQYEDGSLTPAGKARYGVGDGKKRINQKYLTKDGSLNKNGEKKYTVNEDGTFSKKPRKQQLSELYQKQGKTKEEADKIAKGRITTERVLIGIGAASVAAVSAYAITKHIKENKDEIIKSGSLLNRVANSNSTDLRGNFYAANNKNDIKKYIGLYGKEQLGGDRGQKIYNKKISVAKDIKVAGNKNARQIFDKLYKNDSDFRQMANVYGEVNSHNGNKAGKNLKKLYENFNTNQMSMVRGNERAQNTWGKFEKALKDAGYSGVKDVNDRKFSGYMSKSANIYFNDDKIFKVSSVKLLSNESLVSNGKTAMQQIGKDQLVSLLPYYGIAAGGATGAMAYTRYKNDERAIERTG